MCAHLLCSGAIEPAAVVMSGDEITVEMATHHAGDDFDKMVKGDPGMEDIYVWTQSKMDVPFRGRTGALELWLPDTIHFLSIPVSRTQSRELSGPVILTCLPMPEKVMMCSG